MDANNCVMQEWMTKLSQKQQLDIMNAIRPCDTAQRNDPTMRIQVYLCEDCFGEFELNYSSFIDRQMVIDDITSSLICKPLIYAISVMYAAEILMYHHPSEYKSRFWKGIYMGLVKRMHLSPEPEAEFKNRYEEVKEE